MAPFMGRTLLLLAPLIRGQRERQRPCHITKAGLVQRPVQFALVALQKGQGFGPFRHNAKLTRFLTLTDTHLNPAKLNRIKRNGQRLVTAAKRERDHHWGKLPGRHGCG